MTDIQFGGMYVFGCRAECPVCGEPPSGDVVQCPRCGTPHHRDCWEYTGGCALYACEDGIAPPRERSIFDQLPPWLARWFRPRNPDRGLSLRSVLLLLSVGMLLSMSLVGYGYWRLLRAVEADAARAAGIFSSQAQRR